MRTGIRQTVWVATLASAITVATGTLASAAGGAAAGGGAAGGGGGHAGGGGAAVGGGAAAGAGHAGGVAAAGAPASGGIGRSGGNTASIGTAGGGSTATGVQSGAARPGAITNPAGDTGAAGHVGENVPAAEQAAHAGNRGGRGYNNPYAHRDGRYGNGAYGVVYGYPWYPFSYGWNPGWYGNGYSSAYNNVPYGYSTAGVEDTQTPYNNQVYAGGTGLPSSTVNAAGTMATGAAVPQVPSAASVHAREENAVNASPELAKANDDVAAAQRSYDQNRDRVLTDLHRKPEFAAALAKKKAASGEVAAAKAGQPSAAQPNTPASPAVVAAAEEKLSAGDEVTKMEEQAVSADPAAAAAKARLEQAESSRDTLKKQLMGQVQPR